MACFKEGCIRRYKVDYSLKIVKGGFPLWIASQSGAEESRSLRKPYLPDDPRSSEINEKIWI